LRTDLADDQRDWRADGQHFLDPGFELCGMVAYHDVVIRAVPLAQLLLEDLTGSGVAAGDDDRRLDVLIVFHPCSLFSTVGGQRGTLVCPFSSSCRRRERQRLEQRLLISAPRRCSVAGRDGHITGSHCSGVPRYDPW
jgi:hypothetical protein